MGALLELVPDREKFLKKFNQAGIPGVRIEAQKSVKCGITGTHMEVLINGEEEESLDLSSEEGNAHSGHSHVHFHGCLPRVPILLLATKERGCARCGT